MDLGKVLADLREELETLNAAIRSLERLQKVKPRRSGVQGEQPEEESALPVHKRRGV
jgi:hypothetical protein